MCIFASINNSLIMKLFCTLFCVLFTCSIFGQNTGPFRNPSFETSFFPDWIACSFSFSTPDLQPGLWNVSIPPFQGINYMGMVTRGGFCNACNESVSQKLLYPLSQDSCYSFNIMLSYASKGNEGYNDKAILRIWGVMTHSKTVEKKNFYGLLVYLLLMIGE